MPSNLKTDTFENKTSPDTSSEAEQYIDSCPIGAFQSITRTKIIATIGPSCSSIELIEQLVRAGMDVARINCSHGDHKFIETTISRVRQVSKKLDQSVGILLDLSGPKLRTQTIVGGPIHLKAGEKFTITTRKVEGSQTIVGTNYSGMAADVKIGDRILLDDGLIELIVINNNGTDMECQVINDGILKDHQGINLPGVRLSIPALTEKDKTDLAFGLKQGVDFVALSFVRDAHDIEQLRSEIKALTNNEPPMMIVAKLEKPEAIDALDEILLATDCVMVARGDLGVELAPEMVPPVQKLIIKKAKQLGRPVITATQMLDSMVNNPRPTRAEASDVANAIYDGTDAVMLSEETAMGSYPIEAVRMMDRIACRAEASLDFSELHKHSLPTSAHAIAHAACNMAVDMKAKVIATFTKTGATAGMIAQFRPPTTIIALTQDLHVYHQLSIVWGTTPIMLIEAEDSETTLKLVENLLHHKHYVESGDNMIITGGLPIAARGPANFVKLSTIK